eukprot:2739068-Prymnesium_polylepis.1
MSSTGIATAVAMAIDGLASGSGIGTRSCTDSRGSGCFWLRRLRCAACSASAACGGGRRCRAA